jgi:anti-sigma B factor antagonist
MDFQVNYMDNVGVISIRGELDAHTSPQLIEFFNERVSSSCMNYVFDLQGLTYSSSAGIRIFLGLARDSRKKNGDLRIAGVRPQVEKIFKMSKFDKIVKIFDTVENAVNSYKK